jgi:DNA repair protein RecN (Recombination protein N)
MLKRLHIRNYALIEALQIDFSDRLTIITGETGAGKSILLGALGLIMGERADSKMFYNQSEKCVVEGAFEVSAYDLDDFFSEHELDYDPEVVIRREITPAGKSRAFVNDTPVSNQVLQRLTEALVDRHQQFDVLDIHHVNFQLRMIDALADNSARLKSYQTAFKQYNASRKRLQELQERSETGARELDFVRFQLDELEKAALEAGEQERLEAELALLNSAEDIKRAAATAYGYLLENEPSILSSLKEISRKFQASRKHAKSLDELAGRLDSTLIELEEIAKDCERLADQVEYDPQRIQEIQERLNTLYKLQKKHNATTTAELLLLRDQLAQQLGGFSDLGEQIARLESEVAALETQLRQAAAVLSAERRKVTAGFEEKVHGLLAQLAMPHARLQVDIRESDRLNNTGTDEVQFLFASNVGSRFQPIRDVASGGELARLTLCTKSLVADAIPLPTLVFDEIDTGISGDVSLKMGQILRDLAQRHQVVSITHTPQVAAKADKHYFVYKKVEENRTVTHVRLLSDAERVRAIAVMLSGNPPSDSAMTTASELIQN